MTTFPNRIDYSALRSFWIVFSVTACALLSLILVRITGSPAYYGILVLAPIMILFGFMYTERVSVPYRYFNAVLKRLVRFLRSVSLVIVDRVVLPGLKSSGEGSMIGGCSSDSMWYIKDMVDIKGQKGSIAVSADDSRRYPWPVALLSWIINARKWRLLPMLPWLIVLGLLSEPEGRSEIAAHTYTLY
jgi:hypothetical protein